MDTKKWDKQLIPVDKSPVYSPIDGHLIGYIKIFTQEKNYETNNNPQENDQGTI